MTYRNQILVAFIVSWAFAACGPSPEEVSAMTASAWTATPEPTSTPAPTPTPTPVPLR
jgi:hypothetical protein